MQNRQVVCFDSVLFSVSNETWLSGREEDLILSRLYQEHSLMLINASLHVFHIDVSRHPISILSIRAAREEAHHAARQLLETSNLLDGRLGF